VVLDNRTKILDTLTEYIQREMLGEAGPDGGTELTPNSPLLEWGILNSLNTVRLIGFLREEFDVEVPPMQITARYFKDLNSVADLVLSLPRA
jgi:acyl carrier protein